MTDLRGSIEHRARTRGEPRLSDAVASTGGIAVGLGVLFIAIDLYDDHPGRSAEVALFAGLVLVGYVALLALPRALNAAGITAVVIGVPGALGWWLLPGAHKFGDVRPFLVLTILAFALCWVAPLTRGRVIFIGLVAVCLWLWIVGEAAGTDAYSAAPVPSPPAHTMFSLAALKDQATVTLDDLDPNDPLYPLAEQCDNGTLVACDTLYRVAPFGSSFRDFGESCGNSFAGPPGDCVGATSGTTPFTLSPTDPFTPFPGITEGGSNNDKSLEIGLVSLAFGLAYIGLLYMFDRRHFAGLATAFVIPGGLALFVGTETLGNAADHAWVGGLLTFAGGILFGVVGHVGARRFTAWAGGFFAALGVVTVALDASDISSSVSDENVKLVGPGLIVIASGIGLVLIAYVIAMLLNRSASGDGGGRSEPESGGSGASGTPEWGTWEARPGALAPSVPPSPSAPPLQPPTQPTPWPPSPPTSPP